MTTSIGLSKAAFMQDEMLKRADVRSIEIIGEAVKLPDALRQKYSAVEWRAIVEMRDRLIHNCFGVDYNTVRDVIILLRASSHKGYSTTLAIHIDKGDLGDRTNRSALM